MRRGEEKWGWRGQPTFARSIMQRWVLSAMETSHGNCDCCWHPSNVNSTAYDPWLPDTHLEQQGVNPMGLEELLQTCDVTFRFSDSNTGE